jgi:apolipoprotein N-acyltransferase
LQSKVLATHQLHAVVIINHLETQQKNQRVYWYNAVFVVEATFKSRKGMLAR